MGARDGVGFAVGDRVVVIAFMAGMTQGLTAWLLGSSYAVALGVIAGLLDMIPNLGATIAGFILVPVILAEEGLTAALIMLAVVLIYQQVENNVITPKVQGKAVHLSGFFIIVAVTLFGALLGVLGALDRCAARRDDPDLPAGADQSASRADCRGEGRARAGPSPVPAARLRTAHICLRHPICLGCRRGSRRKRCSRPTAALNEPKKVGDSQAGAESVRAAAGQDRRAAAAAGPRRADAAPRPPLP